MKWTFVAVPGLLLGLAACNSLFGVDELSYQEGPSDTTGGPGGAGNTIAASSGSGAMGPTSDGGNGSSATSSSSSGVGGSAGPGGTVLEVAGDTFTIDGGPTFLLGISYFGAVAANVNDVVQDLSQLDAHGFNHVRVWAIWGEPPTSASVVHPDGTLDAPAMGRLENIVAHADGLGMTVDVTFAFGTAVGPTSLSAYKTGLAAVADALKGYRNLMFDLDDGGDAALGPTEIEVLANAVHAVDPARLLTVSLGQAGPAAIGDAYRDIWQQVELDLAAPKFVRNGTWFAETGNRVTTLRSELVNGDPSYDRPIHLQEEARNNEVDDMLFTKLQFLEAAARARASGAAGWSFHNDAGHHPSRGAFFSQLDEVELDTLDELANVVDTCSVSGNNQCELCLSGRCCAEQTDCDSDNACTAALACATECVETVGDAEWCANECSTGSGPVYWPLIFCIGECKVECNL